MTDSTLYFFSSLAFPILGGPLNFPVLKIQGRVFIVVIRKISHGKVQCIAVEEGSIGMVQHHFCEEFHTSLMRRVERNF